jgi:agmatine deiminase
MIFRKLLILILLFVPLALAAQDRNETARPGPDNLRMADPVVLERLREQDRRNPGLPRYMTGEEKRIWQLPDLSAPMPRNLPDYMFLRPPAEYEPNDAILMRWGWPEAVLTSMIVPITTGDSRARVMLVVSGPSQQASASNTLASAGANVDRIDFVQAPSDSVWIRDYGPRFASGDFQRIIIDHEYDRPRPQDNQIPGAIAGQLDIPLYELPLAQGGGNYHSFANGEAFITDTILHYNPSVTEQQVIDYFAALQGVDLTVLGSLGVDQNGGTGGAWYDGTGHLDMWFIPIDDDTVVIGQYDENEWNGIPHDVTEDAVTLMQSRGYNVIRTPGWRSGGVHFTYTNTVIVNDLVIVCSFNGYPTENAQALAAFEQAFPDRTVIQVGCSGIIGSAGALHCIVKHKPFDERSSNRLPYYDWGRGR